MAHGHGRHVSHLVPAERIILGFIIWVPIVYFLVVFFWKAVLDGLFSVAAFHSSALLFSIIWKDAFETWTIWLAPVFIVTNILLVFILVYATVKVWHIRGRISIKDPPSHGHGGAHGEEGATPKKNPAILKYWTAIVNKANTGTPEHLRSSVLEADALVDFFLKQAGYSGEHMADRLGQLDGIGIKSLNGVRETHRLRNDIAHTPGFTVNSKQAEKALLSVRDFLKEMQAF